MTGDNRAVQKPEEYRGLSQPNDLFNFLWTSVFLRRMNESFVYRANCDEKTRKVLERVLRYVNTAVLIPVNVKSNGTVRYNFYNGRKNNVNNINVEKHPDGTWTYLKDDKPLTKGNLTNVLKTLGHKPVVVWDVYGTYRGDLFRQPSYRLVAKEWDGTNTEEIGTFYYTAGSGNISLSPRGRQLAAMREYLGNRPIVNPVTMEIPEALAVAPVLITLYPEYLHETIKKMWQQQLNTSPSSSS